MDLGRVDEALTSFGKALAIRPDFAEALDNRGSAQRELGTLEEALANYGKALAIEPDFAEALNNRGRTLMELGRFEEALASYDKALAPSRISRGGVWGEWGGTPCVQPGMSGLALGQLFIGLDWLRKPLGPQRRGQAQVEGPLSGLEGGRRFGQAHRCL